MLSELFFCPTLTLHLPAKDFLEGIEPLQSLPCVASCADLMLFGPATRKQQGIINVSAISVADWLHSSGQPTGKRVLQIRDYLPARIDFDLSQLIALLLQVHKESYFSLQA